MAQYFFHFHEAGLVVADDEGLDLVSQGAARDVAIQAARDLLAGAVMKGRLPLHDSIVAIDDRGQAVLSLTLGEAVGLQREKQFDSGGADDPSCPTLQ